MLSLGSGMPVTETFVSINSGVFLICKVKDLGIHKWRTALEEIAKRLTPDPQMKD